MAVIDPPSYMCTISTFRVIGLTNLPSRLDAAFLSRFQERLYIGKPSAMDRELIWKHYVGTHCELGQQDWDCLVRETNGWTTRAIKSHISVCKTKKEDVGRYAEFVFLVHLKDGPRYAPCKENHPKSQKRRNDVLLQHMYIAPLEYSDLTPKNVKGPTEIRKQSMRTMFQLTDQERSQVVSCNDTEDEMSEERYQEWIKKNSN